MDLEPEQILQLKGQVNKELEGLHTSFRGLKMAQMKYKQCRDDVKKVNQSTGKEMMVPLTASLYVPGQIKDNDTFLVDIGTGYYVEKNTQESLKFFGGRLTKLSDDSTKLSTLIKEKVTLVRRIDEVLRQKLAKQQAAMKK